MFLKTTLCLTGENVVRGDKESIRNLLEIFDGLLEYLKEEISEGSPSDGRQIRSSLSTLTSAKQVCAGSESLHVYSKSVPWIGATTGATGNFLESYFKKRV